MMARSVSSKPRTLDVARQLINPYESPQASNTERSASSAPFFTRQRVFWCGLGEIVSAMVMVIASHTIFVNWRGADNASDIFVVFVIDCVAGFAFLVGIVSLVVYHWFPDPRRKYLWRRKQPRGTVDTNVPHATRSRSQQRAK